MIITTIAELTEYIEINSSTDIELITPSIRSVERRYLASALGAAQYQALLTAYQAMPGIEPGESMQNLIDLAQEAVANLAGAKAVTRLSLQLSSAGARRSESDTLKSGYQYQESNLREEFSQAGFDALEDMLSYLDANQEDFPAWVADPAFDEFKNYFIQTSVEFSKYYNIKQSRLVYLTVAPIMRNVENFALRDLLGVPLMAALKAGQRENTLNSDYKALLQNYICPAIALNTIAQGMMQYSLTLTESGVSVATVSRTLAINTKEQGVPEKFQMIQAELLKAADLVFQRLGEELTNNASLYPDYVVPVERSSLMNITNTQQQSFFGV